MARSKAGMPVVPAAYIEQLRRSYGSLESPNRRFVLDAANREPYAQVVRELSELVSLEDDTDINCDVCFTLILNCVPPIVVKLSMVGPYALVLVFGRDGLAARGNLLAPGESRGMGTVAESVFSILSKHGFVLPPADHLELPVPMAFADNGGETSLYAALFEPEAQIPWLDRS